MDHEDISSGFDFKQLLIVICVIGICAGGTKVGKLAKVLCEVGKISQTCQEPTSPTFPAAQPPREPPATRTKQPVVREANPAVGYHKFGSIAYSPSTGVVSSGFAGSKGGAEHLAVKRCRVQGGADDCSALLWFKRAWAAFALAPNGAYGYGHGYSDDAATARNIARGHALDGCKQYRGTGCRIAFEAYTAQ